MHYGWIIVAACLVIGVSGYGTYFSFTLFYPYFVEEFGWSRTAVSGAMSLGLIGYGVFALPMGWCVDRFGPRVTIAAGGLIFGCGTCLGAFVTEVWHLYALYGGLTAVGMGAAWAPLVSTISRWFEARRGLAVGIGSLGGGTGTVFIAPLAERLIAEFGWREAYLWLGVISGGLIITASFLLARDPVDRGLEPYGAGASGKSGGGKSESAPPSPNTIQKSGSPEFDGIGAIARTWLFWRMALTFGLWWFAGSIVYVQVAPFILEKGFDLPLAALAMVFFGAGNAVGRIVMGLTSDRFGELRTYQIAMLLAAISMVGLALSGDRYFLLTMITVVGFGFGGASIQLTTVSVNLFGLKSAGAMMGLILALVGFVGAGGPLISGMIYDQTDSYIPAYMAGAGVFLLSLILSASLRR